MEFNFELPDNVVATIKNRKAILLDTCIWIAIAEEETNDAIQLREILIKLEDAKKIFCPLSAPTIWELYKQEEPSINKTAGIMELLSLNLSFKDISSIYDAEVAHFMEFLETDKYTPLRQAEIFGSWQSYLCNRFSIEPNPKATYVLDQKMYEQLSEAIKKLTLSEYIKMAGGRSFPKIKRKPEYQQVSIERRKACGGDKRKALYSAKIRSHKRSGLEGAEMARRLGLNRWEGWKINGSCNSGGASKWRKSRRWSTPFLMCFEGI